MADEIYVKGHERTIARWDSEAGETGAYKPIACLTSAAYQSTMNMLEKVNMCTAGQTVQRPGTMSRSVQIEGEIIDTTDLDGADLRESIDELYEVQETEFTSGSPDTWRISNGPFGYKYFQGFLSDLSDNYQAGEDATFSATLTVEGNPSDTDPNVEDTPPEGEPNVGG